MTLNKKMINFITLPYISGSVTSFQEEYNAFFEALRLSTQTTIKEGNE